MSKPKEMNEGEVEDSLVKLVEPVFERYKKSLHKGFFSEANLDFCNFAAHEVVKIILAQIPNFGYRSPSEIRELERAAMERVIDLFRGYGVSLTNEGILVPYTDEWDYLHDTPRRMLLRGNDKGEAAKKFWESELGKGEGDKKLGAVMYDPSLGHGYGDGGDVG